MIKVGYKDKIAKKLTITSHHEINSHLRIFCSSVLRTCLALFNCSSPAFSPYPKDNLSCSLGNP